MKTVLSLYDYIKTSSKKNAKIRDWWNDLGIRVPNLLVANVSEYCEIKCLHGSQSNTDCFMNTVGEDRLTTQDWERIFFEAENLGVRFVFLRGGEPLQCREMLNIIKHYTSIAFFVFTNGTLLDEEYLELFCSYSHIIPILSLEGCFDMHGTVCNKGSYLFTRLISAMDRFMQRDIAYGTYMPMDKGNRTRLIDSGFLMELDRYKCRTVIFEGLGDQKSGGSSSAFVKQKLDELQEMFPDMSILYHSQDSANAMNSFEVGEPFFRITITPSGLVKVGGDHQSLNKNIKEQSLADVLKEN